MVQQYLTHFEQAHRRGFLERIWNFFRRAPNDLLSFEAVRQLLRLRTGYDKGLQEIELDKIVGSVGRGREFTRRFFPKTDRLENRWRKVDQLYHERGFEPITVYQVSQVYFVLDGNHRVSVSQAHGLTLIEAYVQVFHSPITITPHDTLDTIRQKWSRLNRSSTSLALAST